MFDAALLGLALIQAAAAILFFGRIRAGLAWFALVGFLLFGSAALRLVLPGYGPTLGWVAAALAALLFILGFNHLRKPRCDRGRPKTPAPLKKEKDGTRILPKD